MKIDLTKGVLDLKTHFKLGLPFNAFKMSCFARLNWICLGNQSDRQFDDLTKHAHIIPRSREYTPFVKTIFILLDSVLPAAL